ncbi:glycoside hydrolase family 18 protein [Photobacterium alginatilyticum]|uniref:chitinase n=1 Tax=Photobacterium alginatilyticum TaxID=1775171 RepID=A0ABW9YL92_9GAMM|nr:glycoside hydrolase family 18 protein [Photobacterium alginatilyticum]NBI53839.1 glycoside hydrolase family 18 protein [Photobacterium alginatilyticum]
MKRTLCGLLACSLWAVPAAAEQPVVAGYFADWQYDNEANPYTVDDIPADKLTHVIYAFLSMCGPHEGASEKVQKQVAGACQGQAPFTAVVVDQKAALEIDFGEVSTGVPYKGHFAQLTELKKQHPGLKILPSFGGWTMSEAFHAMAKDTAHIDHFAKTAVELIAKYDFFDGIDLDWEYPGGGGLTTSPWNPDTKLSVEEQAAEREAFSYLVKTLRIELNKLAAKTDRYYELSSAIGVGNKAAQIDWKSAAPYMDNMFAMTYDFLGGWGTQTGHLTNLHATKRSWWGQGADVFIEQMIDLGVPAEKLVLGAAFYGRGWEGTQDFDGKLPTSNLVSEKGASFGTDIEEPGYFMYWDLKRNYTAEQGYQYGYDEASEAPFLWNPQKQVYISFEDKRSVKAKTQWAKEKGLAGVFTWELSGDVDGEMTEVMYQTLND